ncbi:MAG: fluoride efflux transporter CrcB [Alphaproteobacteria bacterium]|nr:fluoride efflux transporter CrcB [Alphaproteobacteria bacterium]MCB9929803.1 fluoride efflux transporter CrcB [Alphaproteobacteria bacterium]
MKMVLFVAAGGALGAMARYGTVVAVGRLTGIGFPWGTVTVNLVGSLVLGLLIGALAHGLHLSQEMRGMVVVGFLGAFTTFSTFSLDAVTLMERGTWWPAFGYIVGSVVTGLALFFVGLRFFRLFV